MKKVIEVKGLSKVFTLKSKGKKEVKTLTAVDNVNFEVRPGEIIGFIGPNGAGKSTTIKMMTGILYPTSGEVSVCGYNPWEQRKEMTYHIATMFGQKSSLISHLPIIESYRLLGAIYDIPKDVLNERIKEITEFFDISHLMDKSASSLSLGQRMICEVAAVTLHRPDVIFFDEPTIGLDIVVKKKVRDMILTLNKKYNTTIFITSHDISDIEKLCSRIILINHGKVMLDSELKDIEHVFLTKKKILVSYDEKVDVETVKNLFVGYNVNIGLEEKITVEFDENDIKVADVIEKLLKVGKVQDLAITSASLENVIYDIYTGKVQEED
ncbi:MAG: ATP-binding cassette domain-containing protein [Clostridia bacterium]|nr:ATP-binding cassette domain-containing protein [Clostridia bacterium]